jgi:hypothetical protein
MRYKTLFIPVLVVILVFATLLYVGGTPHYSLYRFMTAVQNHDGEGALRYVDIDRVAESLAQGYLNDDGTSRTGAFKGRISFNMPEFKKSLRSVLVSTIAAQRGQNQGPAAVTGPFGGLDMERIRGSSIWDIKITIAGQDAAVCLKSNPYPGIRMTKISRGHWKITGVIFQETGK